MPTSASVSSSAQASTTTAMFSILSLNRFGRRRSAFSTSASNCRLVTDDGPRASTRPRPRGRGGELARRQALQPPDALDVDDVSDFADAGDDVLELSEVGDFDDEVVDTAAVVGHRHLGLRDVAVARRDRARDFREEAGPVLADVDRDPDRPLARLLDVPFDVDEPLPVQDALGDRQTVAGVHGEPAPARDEADDRIARKRIAASREPHQGELDAAGA